MDWLRSIRRLPRHVDAWSLGPLFLVALLVSPLAFVLVSAVRPGEYWQHLAGSVLSGYIWNTVLLVALVGALSTLLALPSAWLIAALDFPGRNVLRWLHMLPLAVPTYIAAFSAYEIQQGAIPHLLNIRQHYGMEVYLLAETILRYGLLIAALASVLYPYLFLALQTAFTSQCQSMLDAARTLGKRPLAIFWTISLPLARPALIAGLALISMEVINDYGAIHFFGVPTLTEGIFRTWFGMNDPISAVRLAIIAMLLVFLALFVEKITRRNTRFAVGQTADRVRQRVPLRGTRAAGALLLCSLPLLGGLVYPLLTLTRWTLNSRSGMPSRMWEALLQSGLLAAGAALLIVLMGLVLNFAGRVHRHLGFLTAIQLPTVGYAVPGAVIGAGVLMLGQSFYGLTGAVLSGSIYAIMLGYSLRFLAVAYYPLDSSMTQLCGSLDEASRCLGHSAGSTLWHIHFPLLRPTLVGVGILVFTDVLKELPLTLILRPAGLETLAIRIFGLASEGRVEDCGAPSLLLVSAAAVGLIIGHWVHGRKGRSLAARQQQPVHTPRQVTLKS